MNRTEFSLSTYLSIVSGKELFDLGLFRLRVRSWLSAALSVALKAV
jgi:hypothetical protein